MTMVDESALGFLEGADSTFSDVSEGGMRSGPWPANGEYVYELAGFEVGKGTYKRGDTSLPATTIQPIWHAVSDELFPAGNPENSDFSVLRGRIVTIPTNLDSVMSSLDEGQQTGIRIDLSRIKSILNKAFAAQGWEEPTGLSAGIMQYEGRDTNSKLVVAITSKEGNGKNGPVTYHTEYANGVFAG